MAPPVVSRHGDSMEVLVMTPEIYDLLDTLIVSLAAIAGIWILFGRPK